VVEKDDVRVEEKELAHPRKAKARSPLTPLNTP
jgi:hypothetical protein